MTDALKHPWMLGSDWTIEKVDEIIAAMASTGAATPFNYAAKVKELTDKARLLCGSDEESEDAF